MHNEKFKILIKRTFS